MTNKGVNGVDLSSRVSTLVRGYYPAHKHRFLVPARKKILRREVDCRYDPSSQSFREDPLIWNNGSLELEISRKLKDMGDFYELLTAALFGGEMGVRISLEDTVKIHRDSEQKSLFDDNGFFVEKKEESTAHPDVYDSTNRKFFDSKGISTGRGISLRDNQIKLYRRLMDEMPQQHSLDFVIYVHGLGSMKKFKGSKEELTQSLSKETHYALVLPFSLVEELHERGGDNQRANEDLEKLVYRFEGPNLNPYTSILSTTLKRLMFEDDFFSTIEIMGLSKERYSWETLGSPMGIKIEDSNPGYFPIIKVSENQTSQAPF